jgi:hypothetical protein
MRWIGTFVSERPSIRMSPPWYWYSRLMQLNSVVLPAPLGPINPQMSPRSTSKLTLSSATMPPKRTDTPRTLSSALSPDEEALGLTGSAMFRLWARPLWPAARSRSGYRWASVIWQCALALSAE